MFDFLEKTLSSVVRYSISRAIYDNFIKDIGKKDFIKKEGAKYKRISDVAKKYNK